MNKRDTNYVKTTQTHSQLYANELDTEEMRTTGKRLPVKEMGCV